MQRKDHVQETVARGMELRWWLKFVENLSNFYLGRQCLESHHLLRLGDKRRRQKFHLGFVDVKQL